MSEEEKENAQRTGTQEQEGLAGRQATSSSLWTFLPHSLLRHLSAAGQMPDCEHMLRPQFAEIPMPDNCLHVHRETYC